MTRTEEMLLNMGPQHPSTHGVLRLVLQLDGEKVLKATPHVGYLHRGIEKLSESRLYNQIIPLTDRFDYVASMTNNFAYVRAVEKLLQIKAPERAEYIRTIIAEFQRIASHLLWLGTHAIDLGAMTVFFYCFRERELVLDLFEIICGARLTTSYYIPGGVRRDAASEFIDKAYKFTEIFPSKVDEYDTLIKNNRIWLGRTKGIGVISAEDAINFGLSGPTLRGSGVNYDVRKAEPYAAYDKIEFDVPLGKNGDVYDRYLIRVEEMRQSIKIIKQCLDKMPKGPVVIDNPKIVLPEKKKTMTEIESLIHHFKLVSEGYKTPPGEVYCSTEAPKGELGIYIVSDGSNKPYRMKVRAPSFVHLGAFDYMSKGHMIADIIAIIGTIDIVLGEVDR
ncbi:MAG: NADH dehydrogenase (quinone) subunit D [Nitrospirota bacterium]